MKDKKIHTHPELKRKHNIPGGHVIIDEEFFEIAWSANEEIERLTKENEELKDKINKFIHEESHGEDDKKTYESHISQ